VPLLSRLTALIARAATREPVLLLALAIAAGAAWAFIEIADEVLEGETRAVDRTIILALRSAGDPDDPLGPAWVEEMMRDFTALGGIGVLTVMVLAVAGYLLLADRRRTALLVVAASLGGVLLSSALKLGFDRPRPDLVPHGSLVYTASFPSGHSMMAAAVYLTLGALLASVQPDPRLKLYLLGVAILLAALVGVSRVYLGVHWPTDVVAGWAAGTAWAFALWWFSLRFAGGR
jgi:undecaprenyl-diphosphatase